MANELALCRWEFDQKYRHNEQIVFLGGTDEAGRGAMAGPLVVAAVILPPDYQNPLIRDSKKVSLQLREQLFVEIKTVAISYAIEVIDVETVERLNPKQASIWGMKQAINHLNPIPDWVLVDGEKVVMPSCQTVQLIKGDDLSLTIGAASILAKVTRDHLMQELGKSYPDYDWAKNKGYCTLDHQSRLAKFGVSPLHRKTYSPVKKYLEKTK